MQCLCLGDGNLGAICVLRDYIYKYVRTLEVVVFFFLNKKHKIHKLQNIQHYESSLLCYYNLPSNMDH